RSPARLHDRQHEPLQPPRRRAPDRERRTGRPAPRAALRRAPQLLLHRGVPRPAARGRGLSRRALAHRPGVSRPLARRAGALVPRRRRLHRRRTFATVSPPISANGDLPLDRGTVIHFLSSTYARTPPVDALRLIRCATKE